MACASLDVPDAAFAHGIGFHHSSFTCTTSWHDLACTIHFWRLCSISLNFRCTISFLWHSGQSHAFYPVSGYSPDVRDRSVQLLAPYSCPWLVHRRVLL